MMNLKNRLILLGGLCILMLTACTPVSPNSESTVEPTAPVDPTVVITATETPVPIPPTGGTQDPGLAPAAVQAAKSWLAAQLSVDLSQVEVQSMEPVEWSDACLGLGQPDEGCMQVITPGWQVIFIVNGQTYEVHTNETGSTIRMAEPGLTPAPSSLVNTQWEFVSFGLPGAETLETPVLEGTTLTLEFQDTGQATGSGGCNTFGAQYAVLENQLSFSEIVTTEMACTVEGIMEQEQQYYEALQSAGMFELTENELKIWYNDNAGVLNFIRVTDTIPTPPSNSLLELTNTQWALQAFSVGETETPVVEGSVLTLELDENGQAGGSGGCNQFGALYTVRGNTITFEGLTSTMIACSDEVIVQQEQKFFEALQNATEFDLVGEQLIILYNDGQGKLVFVQTETAQTGEKVYIAQIQMIDAENGWAVGGTDAANPSLILQTTNGGVSWVDRTPPKALNTPGGPILNPPNAYFQSLQQAWVIYPDQPEQEAPTDIFVWMTQDGGNTWTKSEALDLSGAPLDYFIPSNMGFLDGQFGWLLAHLGVGMSHDYFAMFTTQDGGQTWQRVTDPTQNGDLQACGKSGLVFATPTEGWLTGNCPGLMPMLFFYHTTDGGVTWTPVSLPGEKSLGLVNSSELGNSCGITQVSRVEMGMLRLLLGCYDLDSNTAQGWLVVSSDQGQTWKYFPLPVSDATFHFISPEEGWLVGVEGSDTEAAKMVFHTLDGGQTWEVISQTMNGDQVDFVDSQNGWLVSHTSETHMILHSTDGGITWQEIEPEKVTKNP